MSELKLRRLGMLMEPEPGNPVEAEGVLNSPAVRGPDGDLYLFPRMVAKGNCSRIGIARVLFNEAGDPVGIERLGVALEPEADYELRSDGSGGCEDPRVTFVGPLQRYLMTYTAWSSTGGVWGSPHGWLIVYHGVSEIDAPETDRHLLCYSAGGMIFSREHPLVINYRSAEPVLTLELQEERQGIVANVVFPTGIDRRDDLGMPNRFDVYYGMADKRIGVALLDLPDRLPAGADAGSSATKV